MMNLADLAMWLFAAIGCWVVVNRVIDVVVDRVGWLLEQRRSLIEQHDARARAAVRRRDLDRSQVR